MAMALLEALKRNKPQMLMPLADAAVHSGPDEVKRIVKEDKVKVDQKDMDGVSALMHAALAGKMDTLLCLLELGARVTAKDDVGENALMKACREGHLEVITHILAVQAAPKKAVVGLTSADAAKSAAIEKKRCLDAKDDEGITALMKSCEAGEYKVCRLLIEEKASLDAKDDEQWTCLMWAALTGQYEICEMLTREYGAIATYVTEKGETPLMKAAANGHWEVCKFLIDERAKVNQMDENSQTAVMWAAAEGHFDCTKGLLENEAKLDIVTKSGKTALMLACKFGRYHVAELLCDTMKDSIDQKDEDGQTALFDTVDGGFQDITKLLLDRGLPVDQHNKRGESILMWCAQAQSASFTQLLLDAGADVSKQDEGGRKALDHAEGNMNSAVVKQFRDWHKTKGIPMDAGGN